MTDPADRQATATEVYRRLTESPEQRRERAAQEFMTANGLDELVCIAPDGRKMVYRSPAAVEREAKQRALEYRLLQERMLTEAKKAAHEYARDARDSLLGPRAIWDGISGRRIA